jgi:UDP-N-acetylmuramoyl-tripeptide--D-alanyl-D-alanine ligase
VIATMGPAHLELFGTIERVAEAEAEIVAALPAGGTIVVPAGAAARAPLARDGVDVLRYGPGETWSLVAFEADDEARLVVQALGKRLELEFNFRSRHNATNALAALAAYAALGLPLDEAQRGARQVAFSRWRDEELELAGGGLLINDCYNANPVSMAAALEHLAERAHGRRRVAVLGDMAELGPGAPAFHDR